MREKSTLNNFPYLYRGIVVENKDTKNLGRCKVRIPSIHGSGEIRPNMLPWARQLTPGAYSKLRGSYIIPDIGDIVWIFFEGGDIDSPVYLGGTIGVSDIPVDINLVSLYEENDMSLVYNRVSKELLLRVSDNSISISGNLLSIESSKSINIDSPEVNISGDLYVNGKKLTPEEDTPGIDEDDLIFNGDTLTLNGGTSSDD